LSTEKNESMGQVDTEISKSNLLDPTIHPLTEPFVYPATARFEYTCPDRAVIAVPGMVSSSKLQSQIDRGKALRMSRMYCRRNKFVPSEAVVCIACVSSFDFRFDVKITASFDPGDATIIPSETPVSDWAMNRLLDTRVNDRISQTEVELDTMGSSEMRSVKLDPESATIRFGLSIRASLHGWPDEVAKTLFIGSTNRSDIR
jgi:hypothetical protein